MKRGIAWTAAGLGTLLCLACCLPPFAAIGGLAAALILGFLVGKAGLVLLALALIAVGIAALSRTRMDVRRGGFARLLRRVRSAAIWFTAVRGLLFSGSL